MSLPALTASTAMRRCQWYSLVVQQSAILTRGGKIRTRDLLRQHVTAVVQVGGAGARHARQRNRRPQEARPLHPHTDHTEAHGVARRDAHPSERRGEPRSPCRRRGHFQKLPALHHGVLPPYESGQLYTESFLGLSTDKISWPSSLPPGCAACDSTARPVSSSPSPSGDPSCDSSRTFPRSSPPHPAARRPPHPTPRPAPSKRSTPRTPNGPDSRAAA